VVLRVCGKEAEEVGKEVKKDKLGLALESCDGLHIETVVLEVYETSLERQAQIRLQEISDQHHGKELWLVLMSPHVLDQLVPDALSRFRFATLGPTTAAAARAKGFSLTLCIRY